MHFDSKFQVVSNGDLISKRSGKKGEIRWHYHLPMPHSGYLLMLGIGDYELKETQVKSINGSSITMQQYLYPEYMPQYEYTYKHTEEIMQWLEELLQVPYPWTVYRQVPVRDFIYGAMENTSATIFGDFYISDSNTFDRRNYVYVNTHEMAHQWFGNYTTAWSSRHHWLHESFATFFHLKSNQKFFNEAQFGHERRMALLQAFAESDKNKNPLAHSEAGTGRHYMKGSLVLLQLEQYLGEELFYAGLNYFLEKNAFGNVHSEDLLYAFHQVTGHDLQWYWDQWIYGYGEPELELDWKVSAGELEVRVYQKDPEDLQPFRIPTHLEISTNKGLKKVALDILSDTNRFVFKLAKDEVVHFLNPDPGKFAVVKWNKIHDPNKKLLTKASQPSDRVYALVMDSSYTQEEWLEAFKNEEYKEVKRAIARNLYSHTENKEVFETLAQAEDPIVLTNLLYGSKPDQWKGSSLKYLQGYLKSTDYSLQAAAITMMMRIGRPESFKFLEEFISKPELANKEKVDLFAIVHRSNIDKERFEALLIEMSHPMHMGEVRAAAFKYFKNNKLYPEEALTYAVQAIGHYSRSTRNLAFEYLEEAMEAGHKDFVLKEIKKRKKYWAPRWTEGIEARLKINQTK